MDRRRIAVHGVIFVLFGAATSSLGAATAENRSARPWPLRPLARQGLVATDVVPDTSELASLLPLDRVRFERVEMPDGRRVDLELSRVRSVARDCVVAIDGFRSPIPADEGLSMWRGRVDGDAASRAYLAFSPRGSRGWIDTGGRRYHLTAQRGPDGTFETSTSRIEVALPGTDSSAPFSCGESEIEQPFSRQLFAPPPGGGGSGGGGAGETPPPVAETVGPMLGCEIAFETDWQLYQKFGSTLALSNYVASLVGAVSDVYESEIGVEITISYLGIWSTAADPWTTPDGGGNTSTMLNEFRNHWMNGQAPVASHLYHFLSGANLGGGIAWLDVLCNQSYGFGVSSGIAGNLTTPVTQGSNTWDFVVVAHELGHNFGTSHTHNYCPPLDQCAPSGYYGACQPSQVCQQGTIMSYCHLCSGGMSNIQITFSSPVATVMRVAADNSCLPVVETEPDLAAVSLSGPATSTQGGSFNVTARVDSVGATYASSYAYQVRLSSDAVITTADTSIASGTSSTLGASFAVSASIPLNATPGSYHLGLTIDLVTNETNAANGAVAGGGIAIQGSGPSDLVAASISGPGTALAGGTVAIVRDIVNTGGALAGNFSYSVYLSADGVISAGDTLAAQVTSTQLGSLQLGGVTIPAGLAPGSYTWGLIVDPASGEIDPADNAIAGNTIVVSGVAGLADLFVPGDSLLGAIADANDEDVVEFDAIAGEFIDFTLDPTVTGLTVNLTVTPPGGLPQSVGTFDPGDSIGVFAATTGRYELTVSAGTGTGAYTLLTAPDYQFVSKKFTRKLASVNGATQSVAIPAIPGTRVDVMCKASQQLKGKGLTHLLTAPGGTTLETSPFTQKAGSKGFSLGDVALDEAGDHELQILGIKGPGKPVKVTVHLDLPEGSDTLTID